MQITLAGTKANISLYATIDIATSLFFASVWGTMAVRNAVMLSDLAIIGSAEITAGIVALSFRTDRCSASQ